MVAKRAGVNYLDSLRENTAALAAAARNAGLGALVPTCPEWTIADLVRHTARVFTSCDAVVRERGPVDFKALPQMPKDETVVDEFERRAEALIETLSAISEDEPLWNWWGVDPIPGFYHRRMAQEVTIHRYDAELAAGAPDPIDAAIAVDGIDEILTMMEMFPRDGRDLGGSLRVHATDADCQWVIEIIDGKARVMPGNANADAEARGQASDLLLFLWNRKPASALDVIGDADVVDGWVKTVKI